jgi:hypothetical protein
MVIIGGIAGAYSVYAYIPLDNAMTLAATYGIVAFVNLVWTAVQKHKAGIQIKLASMFGKKPPVTPA